MVKRTSLNLEFDLVAEARAILDTKGTTDTIHRALEAVVQREKLGFLAQHRFVLTDDERAEAWAD